MRIETLPQVSVVIPLFNAESFVCETVRSVLAQSMTALEVIVIDDGSTDASVSRLEPLVASDPRVAVHRYPNGGLPVARNRGLALARAPYVAFLDADDLWSPLKLAKQLPVLRDPEIAGVGSLMEYVSADGRRLGVTAQTPDVIDMEVIRQGRMVPFPISSTVFRTDASRKIGGFRPFFRAEDLDFFARIARVGDLACVREPLGAYRVHAGSESATSHALMFPAEEYVRYSLDDPSFPESVSWDAFLETYRVAKRQRIRQVARIRYRQAGLAVLEHRWTAATRDFGVALALWPSYTVRRGWRQLTGTHAS